MKAAIFWLPVCAFWPPGLTALAAYELVMIGSLVLLAVFRFIILELSQ